MTYGLMEFSPGCLPPTSECRRCCCGRERSPSGVTNDKRLELKETMIVLTGGSILGACLVDIGEPYEVKLATFYGS